MNTDRYSRRLAFIDESGSRQSVDPGTYILAAAVCPAVHADALRDTLRRLKPHGSTKLHWHDTRDTERPPLVTAIGTLDIEHLVVVRLGGPEASSERRRRVCLMRMLHELAGLKVHDLVAESRGPADDARDRTLLDTLRAQRRIDRQTRLDHVRGPYEPLLWIPDVVAGAMTADRTSGSDLLGRLGERLTVVEVQGP